MSKRYLVAFSGAEDLCHILEYYVVSVYKKVTDAREVARATRSLFGDEVTVEIFSRDPDKPDEVRKIDPFPREEG